MLIETIDTSGLVVCTRCGAIRGEHPLNGYTCVATCRCSTAGERSATIVPPGIAIAPAIDLCACCTLTPVWAGNEDDGLFCRDCGELIAAINGEEQWALIPMIRGEFLLTGRPPDPRWCAATNSPGAERMFELADRIDAVLEWRRMMVLRTLTILQLRGGEEVPFATYIHHADGAVRPDWKHQAVKRLARYLGMHEGYFNRAPWAKPSEQ